MINIIQQYFLAGNPSATGVGTLGTNKGTIINLNINLGQPELGPVPAGEKRVPKKPTHHRSEGGSFHHRQKLQPFEEVTEEHTFKQQGYRKPMKPVDEDGTVCSGKGRRKRCQTKSRKVMEKQEEIAPGRFRSRPKFVEENQEKFAPAVANSGGDRHRLHHHSRWFHKWRAGHGQRNTVARRRFPPGLRGEQGDAVQTVLNV